ncbi:MAG: carboxypeptidase-like regulatory domain-containing protein [Bacteroidaceae bacterium]|nr:carboxypeptidase-like regulatory domain-containing protein [Bacteroidaceae bacterium]
MRHFLIFACLPLWVVTAFPQQVSIQGRMVDAETGEPLPYVSIYAEQGKCTLTNAEGDFKIKTIAGDSLTFSCIGYEKLKVKAEDLSPVIWLKPYTALLREVTIRPVNAKRILKNTIDNLKKDYDKQSKWTRKYFFRTLIEKQMGTYLAEAFIKAYSVVNIRSSAIIKGLESFDKESNKGKLNLLTLNIHRLVEVAPMTNESSFWMNAIKPLSNSSTLHKYYDVQSYLLHGEDGNTLCRIDFSWKKKRTPELMHKSGIAGTAYIDVETCRLLRFDGSCDNYFINESGHSYPISINFHIEYDYSQDAASVSKVSISGGNDFTHYRALLFALDKDEPQTTEMSAIGFDIVTAIQEAGYDASLWDEYDIVKRTKEEERVAFRR